MFGPTDRDMRMTLDAMATAALEKTCLNRVEGAKVLAGFIDNDKRFAGMDSHTLAKRVFESRTNGSRINFADPRLRGGPAPPLARDTYW